MERCKFCHNKDQLHVGITWYYRQQHYYVQCMNCGAQGPKIRVNDVRDDESAKARAIFVWDNGIVDI